MPHAEEKKRKIAVTQEKKKQQAGTNGRGKAAKGNQPSKMAAKGEQQTVEGAHRGGYKLDADIPQGAVEEE